MEHNKSINQDNQRTNRSVLENQDNDEENGIYGGGPPRLRWDSHNKFSIRI